METPVAKLRNTSRYLLLSFPAMLVCGICLALSSSPSAPQAPEGSVKKAASGAISGSIWLEKEIHQIEKIAELDSEYMIHLSTSDLEKYYQILSDAIFSIKREALPGVLIILKHRSAPYRSRVTFSDAQGRYSFENLYPGDYEIVPVVSKEIYGQASPKCALGLHSGEKKASLDLILKNHPLKLFGTIRTPDGQAVPHARITIGDIGRKGRYEAAEALTDEAGCYSIAGLCPLGYHSVLDLLTPGKTAPTYRAEVAAPGYVKQSRDFPPVTATGLKRARKFLEEMAKLHQTPAPQLDNLPPFPAMEGAHGIRMDFVLDKAAS